MIKQIKNLMLVAVAAMGFASCQNEAVEEITRPQEVVMTITADADDTRTYIDEENKVVKWSAGDQLKVIENSATYRTTTAINIDGDGKATFTVAFPANTSATSFTYNAIFPATAVVEDEAEKIDNAKVKVIIKEAQKSTETSFDPTADVLVSKHIETEAQPTELSMQFKRLVALGKMTLNNLPADAKIERVIFTITEGKGLAGRNYVDATTGEVSQYCYYGKSNTLTISYDEPISTRDIYFTCNPFEMEAGETFKVKAVCGTKSYTREVEIPADRTLKFTEGDLSTFSVDMRNATVETNSVFADGDYAVLAVSNGKYYALLCDANGKRLGSIDEYAYDGSGSIMLTDETANMRWTITKTENGYTFKGANDGYIAWYDNGNYAKTQSEPYYLDIVEDSANAGRYFVVSKADATRKLQRNKDIATYKYFAFYTSQQLGSLYLVPVGENTDPYFTINQDLQGYTADGDEIEFEVIAHNGFNAEVTATANVEWISFDHNGSIIYATAEPNEGAARSATITFSAEGYKSVEVTVKQEAGENAEASTITIAEVLAVGQDNAIGGTIEAVVVSNYELNNLTSKKGMYVQDETGALQLRLNADHTIAHGTKVKINLTGATLGTYNGAVQISGLSLDKITVVSTGNAVTPKTVTMADFLANKYEGQYIALESVQVAASDLSKTWVMNGAHTSINIEDANGNKFVVFSSQYATYGTSTVAQGSGTIKGISSINNGNLQIIFAQSSDFAGMTGARFDGAITPEPEPDPSGVVKATVAQFLEAEEDNIVYELTGVIDRMYRDNNSNDTLYGNFYLKDSTGEVLIYGLYSPSGVQKYWVESGAKIGDTITVQTVRTSYNGTPQGKNAIFVSLTPAGSGDGGGDDGEGDNTGSTVSVDFASQGYTNAQKISEYNGTGFTITFNKGTNSNQPTYYDSGTAIRCYGGNYFTVSSDKTITSIKLIYGSSDGTNAISTDCGSFSSPTWTGSANNIKFTIGGTSKNRRIKGIELTFQN